jgi:predicted metal-binding protein
MSDKALSSATGAVLYVCATCRSSDDEPEGPRAGALLHAAIRDRIAARGLTGQIALAAVECLSGCRRSATVSFAGPGRWSYVYGDMTPAEIDQIIDGFVKYAATPDGLVPWRERPESIKRGALARIPPFPGPLKEAAE